MTTTPRSAFVAAALLCAGLPARADDPLDIYEAAQSGDTAGVAAFLASGTAVDARNDEGMTALHFAALRGEATVVRQLLDAGADVNARDHRGRTPLHYAATSNDADVLDTLLRHGALVSAADAHGDTPLHLAARLVRSEAVPLLLAAGAAVNAQNAVGQTPLHVLGADGREKDAEFDARLDALARVILAAGGDPRRLDNDGHPAWPHQELPGGERDRGYRTYSEIDQILHDRATQYPDLCKVYDLGLTVQGRHIWALRISDHPGVNEDEPEFTYISTMHGNEIVGNEMCLYFIDELLTKYGTDSRIANIVNSVDTWIVPLMNPDGYVNNSRYNAAGVDLNRDFPDGAPPNPDPNTTAGHAPETAAIMSWTAQHSFTLAANFHTGALVVNYPYDNAGNGSPYTPDDDLFVWISEEYSRDNPPMWNSPSFYHGITNGVAWYTVVGGMQDWLYRYMGGNEVTIELSNTFQPPYSQIPTLWNNNRESMLSYLETCLVGVRGIVTDAVTGAPLAASVTVVGRNHKVYTDPQIGDYHRMLKPGSYQLRFDAPGYQAVTLPVTVNSGPATRLDAALLGPPRLVAPNGGESLTVNVPTTVTWQGSPTAQFHVQYTANYGQTTAISDGFESGVLGPEYTTGGNLPWTVTTSSAHSGTRAARAGAITHNQSSWLTRPVAGGPLSFWYRVSSEADYDWFNCYIDGQAVLHRSGEISWSNYATTLTPGAHLLKWEYNKDANTSNGSDTVWVDDLSATADLTTWTDIVALTTPGATSVPWTPTQVGTSYKVRVQTYFGGGAYSSFDESDGTFGVVEGPIYPLGDLNCDTHVDFADVDPFVLALSGEAAYHAQYPDCNWLNADCNQDGQVDFGDIDPFVALLSG